MDDLEVNPLHRAFLTKFRREFEIACKKSYVIAIPRSETLEGHHIDVYFANSHILIPSKLLKMHYNPSQVGNFEDIELEERRLICTRGAGRERQVVRILAEETGYNMLGREYRTLLISEPLASAHERRSVARSLRVILAPLSPRSPSPAARRRRAHLLGSRTLRNHDDCARYLEFISHELTGRLEEEVKLFSTNYVILPHYLDDAAERARRLAESYLDRYERALGGSPGGAFEVCDTIRRSMRLALENHVVHLMHGKLLAAVQCNCAASERRLTRRLELVLASRLSICQLGAQRDFSNFAPDDELTKLARRLPSLQSPLAMASGLVKLVDLISDALTQSVRFKRMLGEQTARQEGPREAAAAETLTRSLSSSSALSAASLETEAPVPICSDDLIASLVFCLPRAKPSHLISALRYLQLFGWSCTERDMTAYYLATLESAIEHILHFESPARPLEHELPSRQPMQASVREQEV